MSKGGKKLKSSIDFHKLCEWFFKEYPEIPFTCGGG